jgi:hypothetical protein
VLACEIDDEIEFTGVAPTRRPRRSRAPFRWARRVRHGDPAPLYRNPSERCIASRHVHALVRSVMPDQLGASDRAECRSGVQSWHYRALLTTGARADAGRHLLTGVQEGQVLPDIFVVGRYQEA